MQAKRIFSTVLLALLCVALVAPPAAAAEEEKTVLTYSIKDARAFLWQISYPQRTFVTSFYAPCNPAEDPYKCDRANYNHQPNCDKDVALGRLEEAPETPTAEEIADLNTYDDGGTWEAAAWPAGNPVKVIHGQTHGRLGSSPEAGGMATMFHTDFDGRREPEAHAESDAYVGNRADYEERCQIVDAITEDPNEGPFNAHVLSRATQQPSVYSMAAFTTMEAPTPPGGNKESVSIVKLWEADGRVHGLLSSTVRGATLAEGQITVDAVRSVISFASDGTKKGLVAVARTTALGVTIMGTRLPALDAGTVIPLGSDSFLGVIRPVVNVSDDGLHVVIRAPGMFLAANTPLNQVPIPEDPFNQDPFPEDLRGQFTLGGSLHSQEVVYLAGAIIDAGVGRAPVLKLPPLPELPPLPLPPPILPPVITPPTSGTVLVPSPTQPVALPYFEVRELAGGPWPLVSIAAFAVLGFLAIMGRWSMRFAPIRTLSRHPPFPAVSWVYRAFLKG